MSKESGQKEDLEARWKTAHDLCSVTACNLAFEDSRDGETYDLGIIILPSYSGIEI